jgi:hypothetical protein
MSVPTWESRAARARTLDLAASNAITIFSDGGETVLATRIGRHHDTRFRREFPLCRPPGLSERVFPRATRVSLATSSPLTGHSTISLTPDGSRSRTRSDVPHISRDLQSHMSSLAMLFGHNAAHRTRNATIPRIRETSGATVPRSRSSRRSRTFRTIARATGAVPSVTSMVSTPSSLSMIITTLVACLDRTGFGRAPTATAWPSDGPAPSGARQQRHSP